MARGPNALQASAIRGQRHSPKTAADFEHRKRMNVSKKLMESNYLVSPLAGRRLLVGKGKEA